ncbi:F-box domain protein, partial [Cooperia oncophora]
FSDSVSNSSITSVTDGLHDCSLSQPGVPFPWNQLPRELRLKTLQNLPRADLDRCRQVNREMFELIQSNERTLQRRLVDLAIRKMPFPRFLLYIQCPEEGIRKVKDVTDAGTVSTASGPDSHHPFHGRHSSCFAKVLRNAEVRSLDIGEVPAGFLSSVLSCFLDKGCRVRELAVMNPSMADFTSSIFLRFLHETAPESISISGVPDCSQDKLSPDLFKFIVTREHFNIVGSLHNPVPVDDDILAQLTATRFFIDFPNMITLNGL